MTTKAYSKFTRSTVQNSHDQMFCLIRRIVYLVWFYLPLPPTRQGLTQGQWTKGRLKCGLRGWVGRERIETRTLLVCVGHWLTNCNVSLMSQAVSWTQIWVQALDSTRQQGLVLYMGTKGVNNAAHLPEGSRVETESLAASSLPLLPFCRASLQPKRLG